MATTFDDIDMQTISNATAAMMQNLGANTAAEARSRIGDADKRTNYLQLSAMVTNSAEAKARHDADYQKNTDLLAQMNESWNANRYIVNAVRKESGRVNRLDGQIKRDVYRLRHDKLQDTYMLKKYDFGTNIAILTTYVMLLGMIPVALWSAGSFNATVMLFFVCLLLVFYALGIAALFMRAGHRRKGAWKQFYWKSSPAIPQDMMNAASTSCGSPDL